jgi:hypothetical protein
LAVVTSQVSFYFRAVILVLIIVGTGHIVGCVWLLLGRMQALQQTNPSGWMAAAYAQANDNKTRDFISCRCVASLL